MKVIITMDNCPKCKMLKEQHPDWKAVELDQSLLLAVARATGITSMPIVIMTDDDIK